MKEINKLKPFTRFCCTIGNLPTSYMESLTYEEQLLWLCDYLKNTVIPTVNNNAEAVEEIQNLYTELRNYVDNYFNNLDVQEEINNKLDQMAQSGQLLELLTPYLFSHTNGGHIVVFGDSWTDENVSIGFGGIGWCKALENKTGLIVHNYAINGSAFGNGMFESQVRTFLADSSYDHRLVDKIIFMGGINDYHLGLTGVQTANNLLSLLSLLATDTNLKLSCQKYYINNWSFVNGNYTDPTTQLTSNDTLEAQMNWYHDLFSNVQSNPNMRIVCINTFDWYPYKAWNETFYHMTEQYKELYQWQQIYAAVFGSEIPKSPYLMKIDTSFGNIVYKLNNLHSITCEVNVWVNNQNSDTTISHNVPYQVDLLKTSNGSVVSISGTSISFVNTDVNQIGYGKFVKYTNYSNIIYGSIEAE